MDTSEQHKLRVAGIRQLLPTHAQRRETLNNLIQARTRLRTDKRIPIKRRLPAILSLSEMIDALEEVMGITSKSAKRGG